MSSNILKILFFCLFSCFTLISTDFEQISTSYFYFLLFIIIFNVIRKLNIALIDVWNVSFLFIILSEALLPYTSISNKQIEAVKFLVIANNIINIGYLTITKKHHSFNYENNLSNLKVRKSSSNILILLVLFYFGMRIKSAFLSFTIGRSEASAVLETNFILTAIISSLGLILPALIAYYYLFIKKTKIIIPFLIASPIYFILFLEGSRFPLLFSFLGFILVSQAIIFKNMNFKKYVILTMAFLSLFIVSVVMKQLRTSNSSYNKVSIFETTKDAGLASLFAKNASPEGIIDMTDLMFTYFETNDFKYGSSTSFILYFWVPRSIWPDKPTMIGHWLIRDFRSGFGSGHSASFGFTGDLYADFGFFSLAFVFLLGRLLKVGEEFKNKAIKSNSFKTILGAMMFPYVFFFVRSPITATMNFLGILFFYFLLKKIFFIK